MRDIHITTISGTLDLASGDCADGRTCPAVHAVADRPAVYYVVATQITDSQELDAFAGLIGPGEVLATVPRPVLDRMTRGPGP